MNKLSRFKLIGRLVNNKTNIAAKDLADSITKLFKKQKKIEELQHIAVEYKVQLTNTNLQMSSVQFKQYHRFMDYLELIIKEQIAVIPILKREVEKKRLIWVQCYKQNKGLKNYIEKVEAQVVVEKLKKEQNEVDSTVTDSFFYKNDAGD